MKIKYLFITLVCGSLAITSTAHAQDKAEETPTTKPTKSTKKTDKDKKSEKKDEKKKAEEAKKDAEPEKVEIKAEEPQEKIDEKTEGVEDSETPKEKSGFGGIAELADKEFVPLEEIEEEELEQIVPSRVHPRIDWAGLFRVRTRMFNNFDLDTNGTSAVLPPLESYSPIGNPADAEKESLWGTTLDLRIDPTIYITEDIKIHSELSFLNNMVLGSLPVSGNTDNPLANTAAPARQFSGRAKEFFKSAIEINELYGELNTIFATLYAGRMDDEWGLGMYTSSGDCNDCDYGNHVDRFKLRTNLFGFYLTGTWDFPNEGLTSRSPFAFGGQPSDLSQIDDADQWTIAVEKRAITREELEKRANNLLENNAWIPEGGLQYRYQSQEGAFVPKAGGNSGAFSPNILDEAFDPSSPSSSLIYKGASAHVLDAWAGLVFQPEYDRFIKIKLEALAAFGNVDNTTNFAVGVAEDDKSAINCFDAGIRDANQTRCTTVNGKSAQRSLMQFGLALESELRFNSPVVFGLNGGFASGGDTPAWGTRGDTDLNFFRFNPDYHVDLILFREIIGTVTNAYYVNPHLELRFFETPGRHLELAVDGIFSGVVNSKGGVARNSNLLGLELDTGLSYIIRDLFTATVEGGILFPLDGLASEADRPRYQIFGSNPNDFTLTRGPSIPWTVQGKLFWNF